MENAMEISPDIVGAKSKPLTVALSPRQTMNFAAGLGDNNAHYLDDDRPGGFVAPPMLAVALSWPLSASFEEYWGDLAFPAEARLRQVHYNESLNWHQTMQCDARITIQGTLQAIRPHRAGTLITIRYEASDRSGSPVFTEYITGLLRDVAIAGGGSGTGEAPPALHTPERIAGGWVAPVPIGPLAAHLYDACTDIVFPIHTSPAFARQAGLPGPIYQGTASLGLAVKEILNHEAAGDPGALAEVHCGFRGMVFPGTTVVLRVLGSLLENEKKTVYFEMETPVGAMAIRGGRVVLHAKP